MSASGKKTFWKQPDVVTEDATSVTAQVTRFQRLRKCRSYQRTACLTIKSQIATCQDINIVKTQPN